MSVSHFFTRFFNRQASNRVDGSNQTVQLAERLPQIGLARPAENEICQLQVGIAQSTGLMREHNEDALSVFSLNLTEDSGLSPFALLSVADGMGGHLYGEIASGTAVRTFSMSLLERITSLLSQSQSDPTGTDLQDWINQAIQDSHQAVIDQAPGGGTTLTAMLILGKKMLIAHIGDSRAYWIDPAGNIELLTRDHSLVNRMVEMGELTLEEAAIHPHRNVLYRALGQGDSLEIDIQLHTLPFDGSILLCSDGLWGVVPESELVEYILSNPNPQHACQRMVEAANLAGGPDNITAILVHLPVRQNSEV